MGDWGFEGYDLSAFNAGGKSSKDKDRASAFGGEKESYGETVVNDGPGQALMKTGYSSLMARLYDDARWSFEKAASLGNVSAMEIMGCLFDGFFLEETRSMPDKERFAIAFSWHKRAAELGLAEAQASVGTDYYWGTAVDQDYEEALRWLRMAADQGNAKAQFFLSRMFREGKGVTRDIKEFIRLLRLSAAQGYVEAMKLLGVLLCQSYLVEEEDGEGVKMLREAADLGNCDVQVVLGNMYYYGKYVEQDYEEAAKWYGRAAAFGSMFFYGFIAYDYWFGIGLKQDREAGRAWFRKIGREMPEAKYRLGRMYKEGLGVPKDEKKAEELIDAAWKSGFSKARLEATIDSEMHRIVNIKRYEL